MKTIVEGEAVARFVGDRLKQRMCEPYTALGLAIDGVIVGGVVFNGYTGPNVDVTVAGDARAWTPIFLRRLAVYLWIELRCVRASITTESPVVMDLAMRLGGRPEGCKRDFYGVGRDGWLYGVLRREWRFKT